MSKQLLCHCACGDPVDAKSGYVEWLTDDAGMARDFRIVHNEARCHRYEKQEHAFKDLPIAEFVGPDGLSALLAMLDPGRLIVKEFDDADVGVSGFRSYVDLVRRLHLPHYEDACRYFHTSATADVIHGQNEAAVFPSGSLREIIDANKDDDE